jgi:uncharacterized membrane protein YoaK (UPF0700 family)
MKVFIPSAVLLVLFSLLLGEGNALATPAIRSRGGKTALRSSIPQVFPIPTKEGNDVTADNIKAKKILTISNRAAVGMGMVLALNSGLINGVTLSGLLSEGTKQASAAVTGAWTNSALGAAGGISSQFMFNFKCILAYFSGSVISGFVTPEPKAFEINVPQAVTLFGIGASLLAGATFLAGKTNINHLFLCCIATGIQNSFTSTSTANLARTTHFTGITSDMGTFVGQILGGNKANAARLRSVFMIALSFWTGGFFSYGLTQKFGNMVLAGAAAVNIGFASYLTLKFRQSKN